MWRYVALSCATKPKILQKTHVFSISRFGCGTMWRYPTLSPNTKLEKHKIFTFQGLDVAPYVALSDTFPKLKVLEKTQNFQFPVWMWRLCGAMWRYPTLSSNPKYCKKGKIFKFQKLDAALCGAIRRYPQTLLLQRNTKMSKFKNLMWHYVALSDAILKPKILQKNANFQISELGRGTMWRYVALSDAILEPKILQKNAKFSNFRIWMWHYVALCGAMWRYPTLSSNPRFYKKHKINQNYKISEFGCGTVWHYLTSSSNPKYCKKSTQIQFQHPASKLLSKKHMPEFQKMENSNLALQCKISNWIWPRCSYELVVAGLLP
jgi:hypothetical protein